MKIAIIGGGNMGGAIARGMAGGSKVAVSDITVADKNAETLQNLQSAYPDMRVTDDNLTAVKNADVIFVAVKPWILEEVLAEIKPALEYNRQAVASIVAGVPFEELKRMADNGSGITPVLYRIIPNTAISLGKSVTYIVGEGAPQAQVDELTAIFDELGTTYIINEAMVPAVTSLTSCGIAFALKYIDASMQGGVELGISQPESLEMVIGTLEGAVALLKANGSLPQSEIDKVTTPGGITLKGLAAMAEAGFTEAVLAGLHKSR